MVLAAERNLKFDTDILQWDVLAPKLDREFEVGPVYQIAVYCVVCVDYRIGLCSVDRLLCVLTSSTACQLVPLQKLASWDFAELVSGFAINGRLPPGISYERMLNQAKVHGRNFHAISNAKVFDAMCKLPYAIPGSFRPALYV